MRGKDLDALKGAKCEKIGVPRNDVGGMAVYRKLEEFIVLSIAAGGDPQAHVDPMGFASQRGHKSSDILFIHILPELLSAQNFVQFGEYRKREQDFRIPESQVKCMAWL